MVQDLSYHQVLSFDAWGKKTQGMSVVALVPFPSLATIKENSFQNNETHIQGQPKRLNGIYTKPVTCSMSPDSYHCPMASFGVMGHIY